MSAYNFKAPLTPSSFDLEGIRFRQTAPDRKDEDYNAMIDISRNLGLMRIQPNRSTPEYVTMREPGTAVPMQAPQAYRDRGPPSSMRSHKDIHLANLRNMERLYAVSYQTKTAAENALSKDQTKQEPKVTELASKFNKARKCVWDRKCTIRMYGHKAFDLLDDVERIRNLRRDYIGAHLLECHIIECNEQDRTLIECKACGEIEKFPTPIAMESLPYHLTWH